MSENLWNLWKLSCLGLNLQEAENNPTFNFTGSSWSGDDIWSESIIMNLCVGLIVSIRLETCFIRFTVKHENFSFPIQVLCFGWGRTWVIWWNLYMIFFDDNTDIFATRPHCSPPSIQIKHASPLTNEKMVFARCRHSRSNLRPRVFWFQCLHQVFELAGWSVALRTPSSTDETPGFYRKVKYRSMIGSAIWYLT